MAEAGGEEITDNDDLALEESFELEIFRRHQWREGRPAGGRTSGSGSDGVSVLRAREGLFRGFRRHRERFCYERVVSKDTSIYHIKEIGEPAR